MFSNDDVFDISPLTRQAKEKIWSELKKADKEALKGALFGATISGCSFPPPLKIKVESLQQAYKQFQDNEAVKLQLEKAIEKYIETEGLAGFIQILEQPFTEMDWSSQFLTILAKTSGVILEPEPIVEAAIMYGKVYWRVIQDGKIIYDNENGDLASEMAYGQGNSWKMTWEQFRRFKNSGKRSGTVSITREKFVTSFKEKYQYQAGAVWEELKSKGILNDKGRFSDEWRIACEDIVRLNALHDDQYIITKKDIKSCLNELKDEDEDEEISKERFVNWWDDNFQYQAGLIWDKLKASNTINKKNKVRNLKFPIARFLETLRLNPQMILYSLYTIANDPTNKKSIQAIPSLSIFRPERDRKEWAEKTGRVNNYLPDDEKYATKIWDVSIYDNLRRHRNTEEEVKNNQGGKLNYDHIPSADFLKSIAAELKEQNLCFIDEARKKLKNLNEKLEIRRAELKEPHITREQIKQHPDAILDNLEKEITKVNLLLEEALNNNKQIENEMKGHGEYWWTIAIPEKLHKQGETYMQSNKDQKTSTEHPFLKDVSAYLYMLDTRPNDFSLSLDDYLNALGAFRYLYHCQGKKIEKMAGKQKSGIVPFSLFKNLINIGKIDDLLNDNIRHYMEKREGIKM